MPSSQTRRIGWALCFTAVFLSALFFSGARQSLLELDPSWHAAIEYATAHRFQYGTQIVFTFGPLGFLSTRTSLGNLVAARVVFAFLCSALVALAASGLAKRLRGWIRYAFLAWLMVFTLSEGFDQVAFFVMAIGTVLLLLDDDERRWQQPVFVFSFIILSLVKTTFYAATGASLGLVICCWTWQRKFIRAMVLAVGSPAALITLWMAVGQSPRHLIPWLRHAAELTSGYSSAMNLVPKIPVLVMAVAALATFIVALIAASRRARPGITTKAILLTIALYVFLSWKEGFTRSGDWHAYVFFWFIPLGVAFCSAEDLLNPQLPSIRRLLEFSFAASMVLCVLGADSQIAGFAWRQFPAWPRRITTNLKSIAAVLDGHARDLYSDCYDSQKSQMLILSRAQDVIGNHSVDVMNYLALAPLINGMNYHPRPVFQGFVAYTPALQALNEQFFQSAGRPDYVLLCHEATDDRFPTLEDSAALNYVLNNYIPVARDGRFLVLQQRTSEPVRFELLHQQRLRFGEPLDLRRWTAKTLFVSVEITPSLLGRAATLVYQQHPVYMRVHCDQFEPQYRVVPLMALRPFLVSPLLETNFDVLRFYLRNPGRYPESLTFVRPGSAAFEFHDTITLRLYAAPGFPGAANQIPAERMLADVQGRVFWPYPKLIESAVPARMTMIHGTPALLLRAPSRIVLEVPVNALSFSGYAGIPDKIRAADGHTPGVEIQITVQDRAGQTRSALNHVLRPTSRPEDRFFFQIPVVGARDRRIILITMPVPYGQEQDGWSAWSQCRWDVPN